MIRSAIRVLLFIFLIAPSMPAQDIPAVTSLHRLEKTGVFAFGGVGFVGRISQGELEYRSILSQPAPEALEQFETVYKTGNPQARSYALVGIKKLSPARFQELYATVSSSNEKVSTMEGCVVSSRILKDIAKDIDNDKFH